MEKQERKAFLKKLQENQPDIILNNVNWPKAYCEDIKKVKAILLGCDPSNGHDNNLEFAFGINTNNPKLKNFFLGIEKNLNLIGLTRSDVYVQNLCQNYFISETSKNPIWFYAAKIWIEYLKEELSELNISKDIPVLLTAEALYHVLLKDKVKKYKSKLLYENLTLVPISSNDNYLERPLIPLFRGGRGYYNLDKWTEYKKHIYNIIKKQ